MPELSIIICTYNRENYLREALRSLSQQSLPPESFEIIVVDNNSVDNTALVCDEFKNEHPELNFRTILEVKPGLSNARNCGIDHSASELIAFMDDDALATSDFAERIIECAVKKPEIHYLGGKVVPVYETGEEPEWMSKYLEKLVSKVDLGENPMYFPGKSYPVGCNMIFRKALFEKYGKFNPQLEQRSDDKYIFHRLKDMGVHPYYCPQIKLYHNIERWRVEKENVLRLARRNGIEERIRVGPFWTPRGFIKLTEYAFKLGISYLLWIYFIFDKPVKGRYLTLVFRQSILGFVLFR